MAVTSLMGDRRKKIVHDAKSYVTGGLPQVWGISGGLQLELLKRNGCVPTSKVLEIGCGCLNAGVPIMRFLEPDNYVGIEPNKWLVDAILQEDDVAALVKDRRARFIYTDAFDASSANTLFDYVISHSVLSHTARAQLELFMRNVRAVVKPTARVVASIRMTDRKGNLHRDSNDTEWQYPVSKVERVARRLVGLKVPPGVTYFSFETVTKIAQEHRFDVTWEREYREFFTKTSPAESHDWIVLTPRA